MASSSLSYADHIRDTLTLAWPVIAGQLGHIIIAQVDNLMIGQLGSTELAASALANGLFFLVVVFGFGLTSAITPITSERIGAGKIDQHGADIFRQGFIITAGMSFMFLMLLYLIHQLMPFMGQETSVVPLAQDYFFIVSISAIPMLFFLFFKHYIEGFGYTKPGMYLMFIMVALNIFFNWLFIYGQWGLPELGLTGAAYATLMSRSIGCIILFLYLFKHQSIQQHVRRAIFTKYNNLLFFKILKIGIPSGLLIFFEVGAFSAAVVLAGRINEYALSAHQIAISIASFTYMFYLGISSAASIRLGRALGRNDYAFIRKAGVASFLSALILIVFFVLMMLLLRQPLSTIYINDPMVSPAIYDLILMAIMFQLFDGIQAVAQGVLRGVQDVKVPAFFAFVAYWVIGIPAGYLLSEYLDWGLFGIWTSLIIGLTFGATALCARFYFFIKKNDC